MHRYSWYLAATVWVFWLVGVTVFVSPAQMIEHWLIAPTMLVGSFVAGSTSAGGGAVAFPVMTLIFEVDPPIARDFSLMIQSVGMGAASIGIVLMKIKVDWKAICYSNFGGLFGLLIGFEIGGWLSPPVVKLFFVSLWLSLALALFLVNRRSGELLTELRYPNRRLVFFLVVMGVIGGTISGITGSGLDMLIFAMLTIMCRMNETVATPTSVVIMAVNALIGTGLRSLGVGPGEDGLLTEAIAFWWCAVPVVVVGAPLGAWFIRNKDRRFITNMLYLAIAVQFIGALLVIPQTRRTLVLMTVTTYLGCLMFLAMRRWGHRVI